MKMTKTKKPNTFWLKSKQMLSIALVTMGLLLGLSYGVVAQNASYNVNSVPIGGTNSSAFGFEALKSNTGSLNTGIGYQVLYSNTTGCCNVANGYQALYFNTTGYQNVANGNSALYSNTTGSKNTASGHAALLVNTTGSDNTANGYLALGSNTTGESNTASGFNALVFNTTGYSNTADGCLALRSNTNGYSNSANGYYALFSNTTGYYNTASGSWALYSNSAGNGNTAVGRRALYSTTGDNNTAIGHYADVAAGFTNATAIGANATVNANNTIQFGDNKVTKIYAGVGFTATLVTGGLQVTGGSPAVGKVLTSSDASGTATWQTITAVTSVTGNSPISVVNGTTAPIISIAKANSFTDGYLSSTDWNTFNSKGNGSVTNITGTGPISVANGTTTPKISIDQASSFTDGYLSSIDWNTFNNKGSVRSVGVSGLPLSVANPTTTPIISMNGTWSDLQVADNLTINGGTINNSIIGGTTPAAGTFTTLKVTGGAPAVGKVLTSDANGLASWQAPNTGADWSLTGNMGTVDGVHFIGTTDNAPFNIRVNSQKAGKIEFDPMKANTFYGYQSANSNTTGGANTVTGYQALYANTAGWYNTANGYAALYYTLGNHNTGTGYRALKHNAEGTGNTAMGSDALLTNNTGSFNTANGHQALYSNTTGGFNTANGYQALYANTTGDGNTAIGDRSLQANTTGNYNTAIGSLSLKSNIDGKHNTAIGYNADVQKGFSNSTAIGNNTIVNTNNKIRLGDASITEVETQFKYTTVSDGRFKTNINEEEVKGLEFIKKLRPVVYNFDTKKFQAFLTQNMPADVRKVYMNKDFSASTAIRQSGFIAQEVEKAAQEVGYDFNGLHKPESANDNYSLAYSQFVVPLVKGMQEQEQKIEAQEKQNEQQQQIIQQLQQQIDELKKLVIGNVSVTKDLATKQIETAGSEDIALYPNPTTGICTITANNINNGVIEIYDMAGNSLQKTTFNNAKSGYQLNVSGYAKGVYLLNIIANNKKCSKRLVIQ